MKYRLISLKFAEISVKISQKAFCIVKKCIFENQDGSNLIYIHVYFYNPKRGCNYCWHYYNPFGVNFSHIIRYFVFFERKENH